MLLPCSQVPKGESRTLSPWTDLPAGTSVRPRRRANQRLMPSASRLGSLPNTGEVGSVAARHSTSARHAQSACRASRRLDCTAARTRRPRASFRTKPVTLTNRLGLRVFERSLAEDTRLFSRDGETVRRWQLSASIRPQIRVYGRNVPLAWKEYHKLRSAVSEALGRLREHLAVLASKRASRLRQLRVPLSRGAGVPSLRALMVPRQPIQKPIRRALLFPAISRPVVANRSS